MSEKSQLVILEGPSGSGKSTVMNALHSLLGWPCYRPFRDHSDSHIPGEQEPALQRLGIPVNTFMEDLFTVDVLASIKQPNMILDRSMPSALAYDAMGKGLDIGRTKRVLALAAWARRVQRARGLLVLVDAPAAICAQRSKRFDEAFITGERMHIREYVEMAAALGVRTLHIDGQNLAGSVEAIAAVV